MAKKLRTLVAALVVPFAFGAGAAQAYSSDCAESLEGAKTEIINADNYVQDKKGSWMINRDALMTKLEGIDGKLSEIPPKTGDALMIVSDMLDKVLAWEGAVKPKVTTDGAMNIRRVLSDMDPQMVPVSVTACIGTL